MDWQLRVFVTVVEEQSFTHAAKKLHISQPAISQHIQALEQRLDVRLLDRERRRIRLNPAGEIVYRHAKEILALYSRMERMLEEAKEEPSGSLRIGASLTYGEYVLPHVIASFRKQYPMVQPIVEIANTQTIAHRVAVRDLDIGVVEGRDVVHDDVELTPFAKDELVIVCAKNAPWPPEGDVTPADLAAANWMIREPGSGTREFVDQLFIRLGIAPTSVAEYNSTQIIKESVEAGLGIALLSRWVVRKELAWGTLRIVPALHEPITRWFSIVTRRSAFETRATILFRDFLQSGQISP